MRGRRYPQRVLIARVASGSTGGTQNPDGTWTPGTPGTSTLTVYDDWADVQDDGATVRRDMTTGVPVETADAKIYLRDVNRIALVQRGDVAHVTWKDGTEQDAEVVSVVRLDAKLLVRFL